MAYVSLVGLPNLPQAGDTIKVYETGTTTLVAGLTDATTSENSISNPFIVPATVSYGFEPPSKNRVDIWWEEGAMFLITDANVRDPHKELKSPIGLILALGG